MGDNCEHGNDVRYGCKHCDDAGTEPPLARGRMTDLPDAVVNAAVEAFARKRNPKHSTLDHSETLAIRAALAAASGPWAEQLDAARPRYDYEIVGNHDADFLQLQADFDAQNDALAAALARNAELQDERDKATHHAIECEAKMDAACAELARYGEPLNEVYETDGIIIVRQNLHDLRAQNAALRAELDNLRGKCICNTGPGTDGPDETCPVHGRSYGEWVKRGDQKQAELDNLRNRVTAPLSDDEIDDLGKELDNPNKVYQLDRIAACIESIITTRAALVRGSDDEAGEDDHADTTA